jgi:hypothetical protein
VEDEERKEKSRDCDTTGIESHHEDADEETAGAVIVSISPCFADAD